MSWLRGLFTLRRGADLPAAPDPGLEADLERLGERLRAAAEDAPPPQRADEIRLALLSGLNEDGSRAPGIGLVGAAVATLALALLVGVGGAFVGSWVLVDSRSADPSQPAELDDPPRPADDPLPTPAVTDGASPVPSPSAVDESPGEITASDGGAASETLAPAATPTQSPPDADDPSEPPVSLPPQASPGGPPVPIPTPPDRGPP